MCSYTRFDNNSQLSATGELVAFNSEMFFVPLILLFAILFGTQGILMAIPIADFIYLLVAALLLIKQSQMFADKNKIREEALALG